MPKKRAASHRRLFCWYNRGPRQWGEAYMRRNLWRIKGMSNLEDLQQDAFLMYLRCYRYHCDRSYRKNGKPKTEHDLFGIYKKSLATLVTTRSKQCFPNTHAFVAEQGRLVVDIEDYQSKHTASNELESCLSFFSSALGSLPSELAHVLRILINDFCAEPCIEQRKGTRLSGKPRQEPASIAIARAAGLETDRDLVAELSAAMGIEENN